VTFEMEIKLFLKVLPDDDSISFTALEDLFVPQTESLGYLTGIDKQQTAAGCIAQGFPSGGEPVEMLKARQEFPP